MLLKFPKRTLLRWFYSLVPCFGNGCNLFFKSPSAVPKYALSG